jgi:hypothetical protein
MTGKHRHRPSPALVISIAALFVALGGTAIAAGGLISGSKLENRSVAAKKLKKHTITGAEINMHKLGKVPAAATADTATQATTAATATNAMHAASADSATTASNAATAANADKFGGLTPAQFVHADAYSGTQSNPAFVAADNDTEGSLSTPALPAGSYLILANTSAQYIGTHNGTYVNCSLQGPSASTDDGFSLAFTQNESKKIELSVTDSITSPAPAVFSCFTTGNEPFNMSATITVIKLGSETNSGTLTAGTTLSG